MTAKNNLICREKQNSIWILLHKPVYLSSVFRSKSANLILKDSILSKKTELNTTYLIKKYTKCRNNKYKKSYLSTITL